MEQNRIQDYLRACIVFKTTNIVVLNVVFFANLFHPEEKAEWKKVEDLAPLFSRSYEGGFSKGGRFCSTFYNFVKKVDFLSLYVYVTIWFKSSK